MEGNSDLLFKAPQQIYVEAQHKTNQARKSARKTIKTCFNKIYQRKIFIIKVATVYNNNHS